MPCLRQTSATFSPASASCRIATICVSVNRPFFIFVVRENYDRPLHRRKHVDEIAAAQRDVDRLPGTVQTAREQLNTASGRLDLLRENEALANASLRRRSEFETKIQAIDERVDRDLRVRTRVMRVERPDAIVNTLGDRPGPGPAAREWDLAAGKLAQHQAAFSITDGLGPTPRFLDNSAYTWSHEMVENRMEHLRPAARVLEREVPGIELSL